MNPKYMYARYIIDSLICENACGGGRGVGGLIGMANKMIIKAILNGVRKRVYDTINGLAGTPITTTGDLADRLKAVYLKVKDVNQGKQVVVMANGSVIERLEMLRDDDGRFLYNDRSTCPISGCRSICFYGIRVVEVDNAIMPNTVGAGGIATSAEMIAVCTENLYGSRSATVVKSKSWETTLTDTNDILLAQACVDVTLINPTTSVAKTVVTL
jgi:hypothetical protein